MVAIFSRELKFLFSSLTAYIVIGFFVVMMGLLSWVFPDSSILEGRYANLDPLFTFSPLLLIFVIPALTMRAFAQEFSLTTFDIIKTQPVGGVQLYLGKYLAYVLCFTFMLSLTGVYMWSLTELASPVGNVDYGGISGSYFGLWSLGLVFIAIGLFASSLTDNLIVAFIIALLLCFVQHWVFEFISDLPLFYGKVDLFLKKLGLQYHYSTMSKGLVLFKDVFYFISLVILYGLATVLKLEHYEA